MGIVFFHSRQPFQQFFRKEKIFVEVAAQILHPGCRVDRIAVIGHLAAEVADFRLGDFSNVGSRLEFRIGSEAFREAFPGHQKAVFQIVETEKRLGLFSAGGHFPCKIHAIPCYLVNVSAVFFAAIGKQAVIFLQKLAVLDMAHFFGKAGGIFQIDKHEYQFDFFGILSLSKKGVDENAGTEFFIDGTDERDEKSAKDAVNGERLDSRRIDRLPKMVESGFSKKRAFHVPVLYKNANGNVGAYDSREIAQADKECGGDWL